MPAYAALIALILGLALVPFPPPAYATDASLTTDINLVTALDVSDSIMRHEEWIEFDGIAKAVVDPAFLRAALAGHHGRIGFAVYTWAGEGQFRVIVPWMLIRSVEDAERAAGLLRSAPRIDRSYYGSDGGDGDERAAPDFRTDISAAIHFGLDLVTSAPQRGERAVLNVCGNGRDNVGDGPQRARTLALTAGVTINGLVLGERPEVVDYYRRHVIAGAGSFVLRAQDPSDFDDAMAKKFLMDLIAVRRAPGWPFGFVPRT